MSLRKLSTLFAAAALFAACSGGGGGGSGSFQLIEFLEAGKDSIPRNATLTFRFSQPVKTPTAPGEPAQDLFERIKIQNVQTGAGGNFSRAIGNYVVSGEVVTFLPKYPELPDRSDAGLRANGSYHVFLKAGADSLESANGDRLAFQQEFLFNTGVHFEDIVPQEPPRALALIATDTTNQTTTNLSRLDPRPSQLALLDSATLIANGRMIEPGAGGAPQYATPWQLDLVVSEPLDPSTVTTTSVQLFEIRNNAFNGPGDTASPGHFGTAVNFRVPIQVGVVQRYTATGLVVLIRVIPQQTLVDDARYRLVFSGQILGIDFRKTFIGDNGLSGDGQTLVGGSPFAEVGGVGYTTEFLVVDRAPIDAERILEYDPLVDGVRPETGATTLNPNYLNSSLYNPPANPSRAVGFLAAFGDGRDGNLAVGGGATFTLDTGDTTETIGSPFSVTDPDPSDTYSNTSMPSPGPRTFDSKKPREWQFATVTVSSSSVLRIIGARPARLRVAGLVQIAGTVAADGANGGNGPGNANGGAGGPGGFAGGNAVVGNGSCTVTSGSCSSFDSYLNACAAAKATFPHSRKGFGPGRGNNGGEMYGYYAMDHLSSGSGKVTGTGGGGGSHATKGANGEDVLNSGGGPGSPGPACSLNWNVPNSSLIGIRGTSGPIYGDREVRVVLMGGSGGGAGGSTHKYQFAGTAGSGGAGGGGGGLVEIVASGTVTISGIVDASGGDGGKGAVINQGFNGWDQATGSGGGGAGGAIVVISGDRLVLTGALLDARGGAGGLSPEVGTTITCANCNEGGAGGKGFIFLMDADGTVEGFLPGTPGNYDTYANGVLSIRSFDASRFSSISAITELFNVRAANPDYRAISPTDIVGIVAPDQRIRIFMSSARASALNPLAPDPTTEMPSPVEVALVRRSGGSTQVLPVPGAMDALNPLGTPNREAFVRVIAAFEYDIGVQAAIGPFAMMDRVIIRFSFN